MEAEERVVEENKEEVAAQVTAGRIPRWSWFGGGVRKMRELV